jgi:hypothetical protein
MMMPQVQFTITIAGIKRADVARLAERIQEKADGLFEDETTEHGRPLSMLIGLNEWAKPTALTSIKSDKGNS